jgi:peptidyl-tRNA hydrolase
MILCVNKELKMGKGKIAAQCCHAAVGCYKRARKHCPSAVTAWESTGCAKVAVQCESQAEMEEILVRAYNMGVPCYLVEDAGRTQIAAGSRTGKCCVHTKLLNHNIDYVSSFLYSFFPYDKT